MLAIDLHLFLKYQFLTVVSGSFCKCKSVWSWFPFCVDALLKIYNHHQIPLKKCIWFHYQPEWVTVYCKSPFHRRTSFYEEHTECILVLEYPSTRVSENKFRKIKNSACNNCSKILRPNLNGEHFEKINIETAITYNNILLC